MPVEPLQNAAPISRLADPYQAGERERSDALAAMIGDAPHLMLMMRTIRDLGLPDAWLVSGALYQTVWNMLTGRPLEHGIKDFDIIYFDGSDLSYEAEDAVIKKLAAALPDLADRIETRNQARVHLWYEKRFGRPYRPLDCSMDALTTYAARTHAVAAQIDGAETLRIHAPFGLANIFAMRLVPNYALNNRETYEEKATRMTALWPELEVQPWEEDAVLLRMTAERRFGNG